jgi:hypothetical protein
MNRFGPSAGSGNPGNGGGNSNGSSAATTGGMPPARALAFVENIWDVY